MQKGLAPSLAQNGHHLAGESLDFTFGVHYRGSDAVDNQIDVLSIGFKKKSSIFKLLEWNHRLRLFGLLSLKAPPNEAGFPESVQAFSLASLVLKRVGVFGLRADGEPLLSRGSSVGGIKLELHKGGKEKESQLFRANGTSSELIVHALSQNCVKSKTKMALWTSKEAIEKNACLHPTTGLENIVLMIPSFVKEYLSRLFSLLNVLLKQKPPSIINLLSFLTLILNYYLKVLFRFKIFK